MLLSHKKEWNLAIIVKMDGPTGYCKLNEISQGKTNPIWFHLYVESKKQMNKYNKTETVTNTENKQVAARGKGSKGGEK